MAKVEPLRRTSAAYGGSGQHEAAHVGSPGASGRKALLVEDQDEDEDDDSFVEGSDSEFSDTDSEVEAVSESDDPLRKKAATEPRSPWSFEHPTSCGQASLFYNHLHDWVLLRLERVKANELGNAGPGKQIEGYIKEMPLNPSSWLHECVILMCGSGGSMKGRLSPQLARILISPGREFIDAYTVILDEDGLRDGDSRSWVISQATRELLGYVVATNLSGADYIIPACDAFNDIARRTGAIGVTLPTVADLSPFPRTALPSSLATEEMRHKVHERGRGTRRIPKDVVQPMGTSPNHRRDPDAGSTEAGSSGYQSTFSTLSGQVSSISAENYPDRKARRSSLPPLKEETRTVHRDEEVLRTGPPYSFKQPLTAELLRRATGDSRQTSSSSIMVREAQQYQDSFTGGPGTPLTAEMLRTATRGGYRHSDRSSVSQNDGNFRHSSRSGNDSDYRHSYATDITQASSIDDPNTTTIKIGNEVFIAGDAEITMESFGRPQIRPLNNRSSVVNSRERPQLGESDLEPPQMTMPYRGRTPIHPGMTQPVIMRLPEDSGDGLHPSYALDAFQKAAPYAEPVDLEALRRSPSSDTPFDDSQGRGLADDDVYPKKGKTRIPTRLVSPRAIAEMGYKYTQENKSIVIQVALSQDQINELLQRSWMQQQQAMSTRFQPNRSEESGPSKAPRAACHAEN